MDIVINELTGCILYYECTYLIRLTPTASFRIYPEIHLDTYRKFDNCYFIFLFNFTSNNAFQLARADHRLMHQLISSPLPRLKRERHARALPLLSLVNNE